MKKLSEITANVYTADCEILSGKDVFEFFYSRMPENRKKKIDRMIPENSKRLALGAGILLKYALSRIGIDDLNVTFMENEYGKPYIEEYPECFFNLSHTKNKVMAITANVPAGCDAEKTDRSNTDIAERFFHPFEYALIKKETNPEKQKELFCRIWTLKESFVKAVGKGLSLGFEKFYIELKEQNQISIKQNENSHIYHGYEFNFNDGYHYACCLENDTYRPNISSVEKIDFYDLYGKMNKKP